MVSKTNLKLTQNALLTPPSPQSISVFFLIPTAFKAGGFGSNPDFFLKSTASFTFTSMAEAL